MWIKMATKQNLRSFSWSKLRRILGNRWINSHNSSCLFVSLHLFFFPTCRFWGSVRRRRPAVTTASEHLCVSVLIGKWKWVYCVYKLSYLYSPPSSYMSPPYWNKVFLFLQKKKKLSWWTRCLWILRIPHIPALEKIMSMVLAASCSNLLPAGLQVCGLCETPVGKR